MAFIRTYSIEVSDHNEIETSDYLIGKFRQSEVFSANTNPLPITVKDRVAGTDLSITSANAKIFVPPLNMQLSIKSSSEGSGANTYPAELRLYNLSEREREVFNKTPTYVSVSAGYVDTGSSVIFSGQMASVDTQREGSDLVTTILLKDSYEAIKNVRLVKKFPANSPYTAIIRDLVNLFQRVGIARGVLDFGNLGARAPTSLTFEGYLSDILTELCDGLNLAWYVVNNQVFISPGKRGASGDYIPALGVIIKPENIKGSIASKNDGSTVSNAEGNKTGGIKFTTFLQPQISIEKYLDVQVRGFEGIYKVSSVSHELEYDGGPWDTIVEAVFVG